MVEPEPRYSALSTPSDETPRQRQQASLGKETGAQAAEPSADEVGALAALYNEKRFSEMETAARALAIRFPQHGIGWKALGAALQRLRRAAEALEAQRKAAALLPWDAETHYNLGNILKQQGHLAEAEFSLRRALQLRPDYAEAHGSLGVVLGEQHRLTEAEASLRQALALQPGDAEGHNVLGNVLKGQGRLVESESNYRRALDLKPSYVQAHSNLGIVLWNQGRLAEAEASLRRALELKPDYAEAHNNLAVALKDQGRFVAAETSLHRALDIRPQYAEAHSNLGSVLSSLGRLTEAEASLRRALELTPGDAKFHASLGNVVKDQGRLAEAEASLRRALELKPDYAKAHSDLLFTLNYRGNHSSSHCLEEARRYGRLAASRVGRRFSAWQGAAEPERLGVGLVSGDLSNHPVGYFLEGLLAHIDPARIELIAYPTHRKEDELTARIRPRFAAWRPLFGLSDAAAAQMIHADGAHVLIDLAGHTAHNRLPVFAWKPAPVQCTWLGYFATTGVAEMDYVLADEVGVPQAHREQFTETVWYLPNTRLCFTAPEAGLPVTPLPALANGHVTFGCFQNLAKVGDAVLAAWGEILTALPNSRLRLQCRQLEDPAMRGQLAQRLQALGIELTRVAMHGPVSRNAYLAAHADVDLILDTFPYPGGTTTCEALWMGVPTLTLAGDSVIARQGASLLAAAGLTDWVAASRPDYLAKALALASDLDSLAALRAGLRQRVLASPLFDTSMFARHFEAALWQMWRRWQNSASVTPPNEAEPPARIDPGSGG